MDEYLLFHLYGPMAAWGDIAVGEQRPSASHPSKSAVMGLVAAALGIRREQEESLSKLNTGYGFSVRINAPGELLRDYHTSQVPPEKRKATYFTRRAELEANNLYTILSSRDYRMEASYTIALWLISANSIYSFSELAEALRQPQLPIYLGRKSCPLAYPMAPKIITAGTLKAAFDQYAPDNELLSNLPRAKQFRYYWEQLEENKTGMQATMVVPRRDQLLNRKRWQFSERDEYYYAESLREDAS